MHPKMDPVLTRIRPWTTKTAFCEGWSKGPGWVSDGQGFFFWHSVCRMQAQSMRGKRCWPTRDLAAGGWLNGFVWALTWLYAPGLQPHPLKPSKTTPNTISAGGAWCWTKFWNLSDGISEDNVLDGQVMEWCFAVVIKGVKGPATHCTKQRPWPIGVPQLFLTEIALALCHKDDRNGTLTKRLYNNVIYIYAVCLVICNGLFFTGLCGRCCSLLQVYQCNLHWSVEDHQGPL